AAGAGSAPAAAGAAAAPGAAAAAARSAERPEAWQRWCPDPSGPLKRNRLPGRPGHLSGGSVRPHAQFLQRRQHRRLGLLAELLVVEGEADGRLDQAEVAAAVEAGAVEMVGVDLALGGQGGDGVGELDLAALAGPG